MSEPVRFSGVVRIPTIKIKVSIVLMLGLGFLPPLIIVFLIFSGVRLPPQLNPANFQTIEIYAAAALLAMLLFGGVLAVRGFFQRRLRARILYWLDGGNRSLAERSAAHLYTSLYGNKLAKIAAVKTFLTDVPADQCRTIMMGESVVTPVDDDLLYEEANALEVKARNVPRGLFILLGLAPIAQLFMVVTRNGINPAYWNSDAWFRLLPGVLATAMIAIGYGLVRSPGKAVIASPRRVQHTSMGKSLDFTPDDSIMIITDAGPQLVVSFYRNDGAHAVFTYPNKTATGFAQLLNRWCMNAPTSPAAPGPSPIATNASAAQA